jgi:hypothetical protein
VRILAHVFYLGHLLILTVLWSALLFGILVCAFAPAAMIHDRFVNAFTGHRRRRLWPEFSTMAVYFVAVAVGGLLLPLWVPFCLLLLPLVAWLVVGRASLRWDAHILWKYRRREQISSVPLGSWLTYQVASVTLLIASLAILACGSAVLGGRTECDTMPITAGLGTGVVWLAPGLLWFALGQLAWAQVRDPARPCRPVLHVAGDHARRNIAKIARHFRTKGWDVRMALAKPQSQDVCVLLTSEAVEEADDGPRRWPLRVAAGELVESAEVYWRLERRAQTLQRRQLIGGLRKLFKIAARRKYKAGTGYWVAPHLWFILGLCRDTEEENPKWRDGTILAETIGPHYHRVLSHSARHQAFAVFQAVEIDLILVEDGVGFRRFCRVLRMLFEIYDVYGGRRRALEIHFQGIPGVRVIIHEFRLDNPFKSEVYPEPEYDDLGRARILHIFRDREEHEEPLESPIDDTRVPVGAPL